MLGTITKAGRVLELFTVDAPEWGVTEAAAALGMPKSGAHEVLATLAEIGLLQRTGQGRYRLGWRIVSLNRTLVETAAFRDGAHRRMQRLADRFDKTLHLAVLDGADVVYVDKLDAPRGDRITESGVGLRMAPHCSAVGKVLLAWSGERRIQTVADLNGLDRRTPRTITSLHDLRADLRRVRERGFALDLQEAVPNLCCVAAPIRDAHGSVQAAMSISVPLRQFRQNPDRYRQIIESAAAEVSRDLGFIETRQAASALA
jgi:DNA-binding IclR family transcriptional regulator